MPAPAALPRASGIVAGRRWSSAASCATCCSASRRRTSTSRCSGCLPTDLKALLTRWGPVNTVGETFTVFKVQDLDVSLPRRESKVGRGHKGFEVHGDPSLSFDEAARRRDFTINAIGWDPLTDEYLDPHGGRADIERRVLRMVDADTFGEDSLRVLRALQFAARFECRVDDATAAVCRATPLDDLPAERIWGEVEKLLLRAERPSIGLHLGRDLRCRSRGCAQRSRRWRPARRMPSGIPRATSGRTRHGGGRGRTRERTFTVPGQVSLMLGALLHDIGKPVTTARSTDASSPRDTKARGVPLASAILDSAVRAHARGLPGAAASAGSRGVAHAAGRVGQVIGARVGRRVPSAGSQGGHGPPRAVVRADCNGRGGTFDCSFGHWFLDRVEALGVEHAPPAPLLLGRHLIALGVAPGPRWVNSTPGVRAATRRRRHYARRSRRLGEAAPRGLSLPVHVVPEQFRRDIAAAHDGDHGGGAIVWPRPSISAAVVAAPLGSTTSRALRYSQRTASAPRPAPSRSRQRRCERARR